MAITEDASTPAIATGTGVGALATASFSPPAGSWIIALVAAQYTDNAGGPGLITIADSAGGTWVAGPTLRSTSGSWFGRTAIMMRYCASAPGSITVTATFPADFDGGRFLACRVLNGAAVSQAGAATATRDVTPTATDWTHSITTTVAGSQVYGLANDPVSNDTFSAAAATSFVGSPFVNGSDQTASVAFKATAVTGTPGATTLGVTISPTQVGCSAMLEVLPAANGGPPLPAKDLSLNSPGQPPGAFGRGWKEQSPRSAVAETLFQLTNNAEGGTDTATVTTGEAGSGDPWDSVIIGTDAAVTWVSSPVLVGTRAIKYEVGATSASAYTQWMLPGGDRGLTFIGFWFEHESTFGNTASIFSLNQGGTAYIRTQITGADKIRVLSASGATLYTSTYTLTPGDKYFLSMRFVADVNGSYMIDLYDSTGTLVETIGPSAGDFTGKVDRVRFGSVANQTSTNWRPVTIDQFEINNFAMIVPEVDATNYGVIAGTLPALTGEFDGTASATGDIDGTLPNLTADFNGTSEAEGPVAGLLPNLVGDFNGTAKGNAALAGTLPNLTGDFNGEADASAVLAGTLPNLTADLNGTGKASGALSGTLSGLQGDFNGTSRGIGALAGTLPALTGDFNEASKASGPIAGTLPNLTGDFAGTVTNDTNEGVLAGTLPNLTADLNGSSKGTGALAGTLPNLVGGLNGTAKASGGLAGTLPGLTADLNGTGKASGPLSSTLPKPTADFNGTGKASGPIAGTLPSLTADWTGTSEGEGPLQGNLPNLAGDFNGTARTAGTLNGTLPALQGDFAGSASGGYLNGYLPSLTADFTGAARASGALAGTLSKPVADFAGWSEAEGPVAGQLGNLFGSFAGSARGSGVLAGVLPKPTADFTGTSPDVLDQSDLFPFFARRYSYATTDRG